MEGREADQGLAPRLFGCGSRGGDSDGTADNAHVGVRVQVPETANLLCLTLPLAYSKTPVALRMKPRVIHLAFKVLNEIAPSASAASP